MVFWSGNKSPGSLGNRAFQLYTCFMCLVCYMCAHACVWACGGQSFISAILGYGCPSFVWGRVSHWAEALILAGLIFSAGLQCTAAQPASTHVLESDLGSSCLYTSALLLYRCFTLKCYFYCAGVCMICVGWRAEDNFGSSFLSEASGGGAQVSRIQQQLGSLRHLPSPISLTCHYLYYYCVYTRTRVCMSAHVWAQRTTCRS